MTQKILQRLSFSILLALLVLFTLIGTNAFAQGDKPDRYVKIRLLAENNKIKAGQDLRVAIEKSIYPHWHTYWINPGDSGAALNAEWSMPDGFEVSEIAWPTPKKIPYGPLLNYGYEGNVVLLQTLQAPDEIPDGPLVLTADIDLLVCEEICIPEIGTYELILNDPNAPETDNAAFFEKAEKKMPTPVSWDAGFSETAGNFVLTVELPAGLIGANPDTNDVALYPLDWGIIENPATPEITIENDTLTITQKRGDRALSVLESFGAVLAIEQNGQKTAYQITAQANTTGTIAKSVSSVLSEDLSANIAGQSADTTIWIAIWSALIGGIILNLMPCVFPVLSIKALSLVKISEEKPALARLHGIAYTLGVVLSFLLIAGILIALQSGGAQIGWGFQLQNPVIVGALAYLLFLVGLNLMGMFEVSTRFTNIGNRLTQGQNVSNSFFTGILATLVATPCTAPFMGAAIGFALVQPAIIGLAVFAALGFGLALPYLLLSFIPGLQRILPKPGPWMDRFKEFLSFPMFASAAWLVWVVSQQTGPNGVFMLLLGFTLIAFIAWLIKHMPASGSRRRVGQVFIILSSIVVLALLPAGLSHKQDIAPAQGAQSAEQQFGEVFSNEYLEELLQGDDPVFVEMTAAWCITCKYNHAVAININATKDLFAARDVQYLIGDWTNQDPEITKYLEKYGRNGVPIYVYYGPRNETGERPQAAVLPQILTPGIVASYVSEN